MNEDDNLLIYYAGHGYYHKDAVKAYWLPADADEESEANWIGADDIRALPAKHVPVISDSCSSGALTRDVDPLVTIRERERYLQKARQDKSRTLLASEAKGEFQEAVRLDPNNKDAQETLGRVLSQI